MRDESTTRRGVNAKVVSEQPIVTETVPVRTEKQEISPAWIAATATLEGAITNSTEQ